MQPDLLDIFASYTSWKYNEDTWIINFMDGSQNMYLLEGDEKSHEAFQKIAPFSSWNQKDND